MATPHAAGDTGSSEAGERRRERIYWYGALALLVAWPLVLQFVVPPGEVGLHWQRPNGFQLFLAFFPGLLIALLLELFVSTLAGGRPRLFRTNPSVSVRHRLPGSLAECAAGVLLRLQQEGFRPVASPDARAIEFAKEKNVSATAGFDSHKFSGKAVLVADGAETGIQMTLVFHETVLIETGETARLNELASRLCAVDGAPPGKEVPLLVITGLADGVLSLLVTWVPWFRTEGIGWLCAFVISTVGLSLVGLVELMRKRTRFFGIRLGVLGLCLGLAPLGVMLWKGAG